MMKNLMVRKSLSPAKKNNKGFTLIELIIVIAIIAVLAAVVAPQYLKYVEKSKAATDKNTAATIEQTINVLCADGTITSGATVTWTVTSGLTSSDDSAVIAGKIQAITGTIGAAKSKTATTQVWTISFGTDGTPSVTVSPGYSTWGD